MTSQKLLGLKTPYFSDISGFFFKECWKFPCKVSLSEPYKSQHVQLLHSELNRLKDAGFQPQAAQRSSKLQ